MSSSGFKSAPAISKAENITDFNDGQEDQEDLADAENMIVNNLPSAVTSHVRIKPVHSKAKLDKEVVRRRIRQMKRVNKVRAALQGLFGLPADSSKEAGDRHHKVSVKWVDDAFAAP